MAYRVNANRINSGVTVVVTSNSTIVIAGNTTQSNVATGGEVLSGASIERVYYGMDTGFITIARGSNTVAVFSGTGYVPYADHGNGLDLDTSANVVVTMSAVNAYCMIQLAKIFTTQDPSGANY